MKWQWAKRSGSDRAFNARFLGVGAGALLALRFVACSSDGGQPNGNGTGGAGGNAGSGGATVGAVCGNNVLESGEVCDGPVQVTCGMATMNVRPLGVVKCTACQFDVTGCTSAGSGGTPGGAGTSTGTGASGGSVMGNGGTAGGGVAGAAGAPFGGITGAGGTLGGNGGTPAGGGTTATGGAAGSTAGSSGVLGDVDALRKTCLDTINMYRATKNIAPLTLAAASVETCSDTGAQADATAGVAHGSAGKCPGMGAQDTCPGWPPKQYGGAAGALKSCLMSMWNEGEPPEGRDMCLSEYFMKNVTCFEKYGHYLNMSDPSNTVVACGFYVMPNGDLWMNQDLGH